MTGVEYLTLNLKWKYNFDISTLKNFIQKISVWQPICQNDRIQDNFPPLVTFICLNNLIYPFLHTQNSTNKFNS